MLMFTQTPKVFMDKTQSLIVLANKIDMFPHVY